MNNAGIENDAVLDVTSRTTTASEREPEGLFFGRRRSCGIAARPATAAK